MKTKDNEGVHTAGSRQTPSRVLVITAFAAVYVLWGSTYLGIRYAVETIPPFLMAGSRSLAAGLLLYACVRLSGAKAPNRHQWRDAAIAGGLLLTMGNGGVTWAERVIPSGVTALLVGLVPFWMVLVDWLRPGGVRPRFLVMAGLAVGFVGVAILAREWGSGAGSAYGWNVAVLMVSSIAWAVGSVFSRHAQKPASPLLTVAMQMIAGGTLLLVLAAAHGEVATFSFRSVSTVSAMAWIYLAVAGSLIGFTAYVWLLQVSTPARVATYAYVNPFIAVLLGCTIGREPFSRKLFISGALIVMAVALIVRSGSRAATAVNENNLRLKPVTDPPLRSR